MSTGATIADVVTVVVARTVRVDAGDAWLRWLDDVREAASAFPGHLGLAVLPAVAPSRDWVYSFRFDSAEHLLDWQRSETCRELMQRADAFCEQTRVLAPTGLEAWFTAGDSRAVIAPPRWKQTVVAGGVAFVTVQLLQAAFVPVLVAMGLPVLLRGMLVTATMVTLMTYVLMPRVSKLLARWLYAR